MPTDPTPELRQIIEQLDALPGDDTEAEHGTADELILVAMALLGGADVADAYERAKKRAGGYWYA